MIGHDHLSLPGAVGERLVDHGWDVTELVVVPAERYEEPNVECVFPDPLDWDLIVPLGSPWSVNDVERIGAWIAPELVMLRKAHEAGVPVLGICFGGQALAAALGGSVERAPRAEIGWVAVETDDPSVVGPGPWFQFHYDRFLLPPGAVEVARNGVCSQAFTIGRSLGLQFHPEITAHELELWLGNGGEAEVRSQGLEPEALMTEMRREEPASFARTRDLVDGFLMRMAR